MKVIVLKFGLHLFLSFKKWVNESLNVKSISKPIVWFLNAFGKEFFFKVKARAVFEKKFIVGFRQIEVEYDNELLVKFLLVGGGDNSSVIELRLLHQILKSWRVKIYHILKIYNSCRSYD